MRTAAEPARGGVWLRTIMSERQHERTHTHTHTHIAAIKACGLFKMAENQFNETKVNGRAVLLLHFPFCASRQERERALS